MDHIRRNYCIRLHWRCLLLRDSLPVHSHQLLLEQGPVGLLRTHRRYHRPHFLVFGMRDHLGLYLRHSTNLPRMGPQHASQDKDHAYPGFGNGLRVCSDCTCGYHNEITDKFTELV